jgi:transcriptional regulator with XRE-family HTH domain
MSAKTMSLILAANLKLLVEERGLSMKELSRAAGGGDTLVYDIIHQRAKSPKIETIEALAAALSVTVADLLREGQRDQTEQELLAAFDLLPPADRQRLIATARAWLPQED